MLTFRESDRDFHERVDKVCTMCYINNDVLNNATSSCAARKDFMTIIQKDTRIDLRIGNSQKDFLVYAAGLKNMKLSAFVLNSAIKEAEDIVANKTQFSLSEDKWKVFCTALDRPARENTKLKKLFKGPDLFHE